MQSIGERLEEARKRKGISLREAGEATKIRVDFLGAFEMNRFSEVPLPDIYKRGFLKNYARFLHLDPEKLLADFTAHQLGNTRRTNREGRELFGRMDLPPSESNPRLPSSEDLPSPEPRSPTEPVSSFPPRGRTGLPFLRDMLEPAHYWKVGLAVVAVLLLGVVLFALVKAVLSGPASPSQPPAAASSSTGRPSPVTSTSTSTTSPAASATPATSNPLPAGVTRIVLIGKGEVFVQVKQLSDNQFLYRGTLSAGERIPLEIRGPADIAFTQAANLEIEKDGRTVKPDPSRGQYGKINTSNL